MASPLEEADGQDSAELNRHMQLLRVNTAGPSLEIRNTPIFSSVVRKQASKLCKSSDGTPFTQYGLLGGISQDRGVADPRLFYNVATPSSVFICGSQGSGKSHSLSCLLENCLLPSEANVLPRPLTGIVFHYDTFNSGPSEAAYLSSNPQVKVRVLCAPTNRAKMEKIYSRLPNVVVTDFRIHESQLNTKRMLGLMGMGSAGGDAWPLYMHTVLRILRQMRLDQQARGEEGFSYGDFKRRLTGQDLGGPQLGPLHQRLDALESFMVPINATRAWSGEGKRGKVGKFAKRAKTVDETWTPEAGRLTIVDLSCSCMTDVTACSLFTICLSLFLEQESDAVGRVVALDEAHKYMTGSLESETLTEQLLSAIRLQRHLAARVFISTQEPTISPKLLDLCSATIVHRFTSPEWLMTLKAHLAGASELGGAASHDDNDDGDAALAVPPILRSGGAKGRLADIFQQIVSLRTGEALLFAPNAAIGVRMERVLQDDDDGGVSSAQSSSSGATHESESTAASFKSSKDLLSVSLHTPSDAPKMADAAAWRPTEAIRLGSGVLKIFIRQRVTQDGGQSIMAG